MFYLEKELAAWRRAYEHRRAFRDRDLDELEWHLRDHVRHLCAEGWTEQAAFHAAMQEIGDCTEAEPEYEKVYWGKVQRDQKRIHELLTRGAMFKNYVMVAFRNVRKHKGYTFINIAGLAMGLACCLLLGLYVHHEWSYDRFHEHADRIYRVGRETQTDAVRRMALSSMSLARDLQADIPEIASATRLVSHQGTVLRSTDSFLDQPILLTDSTFFDLFSFPLIQGNPTTALVSPHSLVLTQRAATRYFQDVNPVGETIEITFFGKTATYTITGLVANPPPNSHLQFDALRSFSTLEAENPERAQRGFIFTYALLQESVDANSMTAKLDTLVADRMGPEALAQIRYFLQPLTDIHLHSDLANDFHAGNSAQVVYILALIGVFILLIACINFMNLATARSSERAREVGVRKALGAHRQGLMRQFLLESTLLTLFAVVLAFCIAFLAFPAFVSFTGKTITHDDLFHPILLLSLLAGALLVGIVAGSYPALVLSGFKPIRVLKGAITPSQRSIRLRQSLVVLQFTITIALLASTFIAFQQLDYIRSKDLGFDQDMVVTLNIPGGAPQLKRLEHASLTIPGIDNLTAASSTRIGTAGQRYLQHPQQDTAFVQINFLSVADNYLDVLGMDVVAGRSFSAHLGSDSTHGAILNEAAVRQLGWATPEDAIGQELRFMRLRWTVVGVVSDYHYQSLHRPIAPLLLQWRPSALRQLLVRLRPHHVPETLAALETAWQQQVPNRPFEVGFLDDQLETLYQHDQQQGRVFGLFSSMAILIASLGLFGLAAFAASQRTKEIGIRKVLGASVPNLIQLFTKEFVQLVTVALIIATPMAYFAMSGWLDNFAYRTTIDASVFIWAGLLAMGVALFTVSFQAIKAAVANPIVALRHE